ncbi:MAG TPA: sigma factor-like helix-turn-helix DNA-binding protein, partial [Phycisphaerae bacterium]|nr:sigma factor-like helix-turn-helix DNA-binding protein [Phycisphaerae bacterium]
SIEESSRSAVQKTVAAGLAALTSRERKIVERHFGLASSSGPDTLDAISRDIGISKERIRQIERRALAKLRDHLGDKAIELLAG